MTEQKNYFPELSETEAIISVIILVGAIIIGSYVLTYGFTLPFTDNYDEKNFEPVNNTEPDKVWNGDKWVNESNYTQFTEENFTWSIENWSSVVTVEDYRIEDKKLYTTFNVENYTKLGGVDCSLRLKHIEFKSDREDYTSKGKVDIPGYHLCVGDKITVGHETSNVYPHPKGILQSQFKYSLGPFRIDNTTKVTQYREGTFHITVE